MKLKTKNFAEDSRSNLEMKVEKWFSKNDIELIDIKYEESQVFYYPELGSHSDPTYYCHIIYKDV